MIPTTARVDQFATVHERKEGELYVDWDEVRGFATNGSNGERRLALALLAMGRRVEELEDEISIWRSFMVPEPVRGKRWAREVKEAAQEPVHASREEIRRAVREEIRRAIRETTRGGGPVQAVREMLEKAAEVERKWR